MTHDLAAPDVNRRGFRQAAWPAAVLLVALCLTNAGASADSYLSPDTIQGAVTIDAERLIELVNRDPGLILIDSRLRTDRNMGFIPGSVSLPDTLTDCESLARITPEKSSNIVFYCNGPRCRRSDRAVMIATQCGYSTIHWFRGGMESWRAGTYPIDQ